MIQCNYSVVCTTLISLQVLPSIKDIHKKHYSELEGLSDVKKVREVLHGLDARLSLTISTCVPLIRGISLAWEIGDQSF